MVNLNLPESFIRLKEELYGGTYGTECLGLGWTASPCWLSRKLLGQFSIKFLRWGQLRRGWDSWYSTPTIDMQASTLRLSLLREETEQMEGLTAFDRSYECDHQISKLFLSLWSAAKQNKLVLLQHPFGCISLLCDHFFPPKGIPFEQAVQWWCANCYISRLCFLFYFQLN